MHYFDLINSPFGVALTHTKTYQNFLGSYRPAGRGFEDTIARRAAADVARGRTANGYPPMADGFQRLRGAREHAAAADRRLEAAIAQHDRTLQMRQMRLAPAFIHASVAERDRLRSILRGVVDEDEEFLWPDRHTSAMDTKSLP